jgi:hypothetical protein
VSDKGKKPEVAVDVLGQIFSHSSALMVENNIPHETVV